MRTTTRWIILLALLLSQRLSAAGPGCPDKACHVDGSQGVLALNAALVQANCGDDVRISGRFSATTPVVLPPKSPECTETTRIHLRRDGPLPVMPNLIQCALQIGPDFAAEQAFKAACFERIKVLMETDAPVIYTEQAQVCAGSGSPFWVPPHASYYDVEGIKLTTTNEGIDGIDGCPVYGLVIMGINYPSGLYATRNEDLPHHIRFRQMVLKGTERGDVVRAIFASANAVEMTDSLCYDIHASVYDSQCYYSADGNGPHTLRNNWMRAAGENFLFGGSNPIIPGAIPSDIEVSGNVLDKDFGWWRQADHIGYAFTSRVAWTVKNLGECKNCQRAKIFNNLAENNWEANQIGGAFLFQSVKDGPNCDWCTVRDVSVYNNVIRNVSGLLHLGGYGGQYGGGQPIMARIRFINNLGYNISTKFAVNGTNWGGCFRFVSGSGSSPDPDDTFDDVEYNHNTCINDGGGSALLDWSDRYRRLQIKNSIGRTGYDYYDAILGMASGTNAGIEGWRVMTVDSEGGLSHNVLGASANQTPWPQPNWFVRVLNDVAATKALFMDLFVDAEHNDFHLKPGSIYGANAPRSADDGTAIGVDFAKLPLGPRVNEPPPPQDFTSHPAPAPTPVPTPVPDPVPVPTPTPVPPPLPQPTTCAFLLSTSSVIAMSTGNTFDVVAAPNAPSCAASVEAIPGVPPAAWVTWSITGNLATFVVAANETTVQRYTAVYVGGQAFTIMQGAGPSVPPPPSPPPPVPVPVPVPVPPPPPLPQTAQQLILQIRDLLTQLATALGQ